MAAWTTEDMSGALSAKYPKGGYGVIDGIPFFTPEFRLYGYTQPTQIEIDTLVNNYTAIAAVRARRLAEIKSQSVERFRGYELYSDLQSVIDYGAALRAVSATATTEMAALPDVASVKNYQPAWPTKPNL